MRTLLFVFTFLFSFSLNAQVFVKHDAMGNNDGTSWGNAYTDLHDALANHPESEIWIASGIYTPASTPNNFFEISSVVSLYGGFAGMESDLSERNLEDNLTVLSGDINQDDTPNDFSINRTDNATHVLQVYDTSATLAPVIIDGFTFSGGHTSDDPDAPIEERAGGGIFSFSTMEVRNCTFDNNFGRSGAGVLLSSAGGKGDNSVFDNCVFSNNITTAQCAGLFLVEVDDVSVTNCSFTNNNVVRGALYPLLCNNLTVDNCLFQNNNGSPDDFGGAIFSWANIGMVFSNCTFENNVIGNGSVIYHDGRDAEISADNVVFDDCEFTNNTALDWGGPVVYSWQGGFTFDNCTITGNSGDNGGAIYIDLREKGIGADHIRFLNSNFTGNIANDFGGGAIYSFRASFTADNCTFDGNLGTNGSHIFTGGSDKEVVISNTTFSNGVSNFAAAHTCYGENSDFYLTNNTYDACEAGTSGGALLIGFKARVFADSCNFTNNLAQFGGAVYAQGDSTEAHFSNCNFDTNLAIESGGAIRATSIPDLTIDACEFKLNSASRGGAIHFTEFDTIYKPAELLLTNSIFQENACNLWGGAVSNVNVDATLHNNLFFNNFSNSESGGAIANIVSDSTTAVMNMVNNTLANNFALSGTEIYQFAGTEASATLNVQNNIFSSEVGSNYFAEAENIMPLVVSTGGNISNDASTSTDFNDMLDQNDVDDLYFLNSTNGNYQLFDTSPAIDAGVEAGAPTTDILGNTRVGAVDAGAYEQQQPVATETIIEDENALTIFPNPVKDQLNYQVNDAIQGELFITIYDVTGKIVMTWRAEKNGATLVDIIDVKALQTGVYDIFISNGKEAAGRRFVKM